MNVRDHRQASTECVYPASVACCSGAPQPYAAAVIAVQLWVPIGRLHYFVCALCALLFGCTELKGKADMTNTGAGRDSAGTTGGAGAAGDGGQTSGAGADGQAGSRATGGEGGVSEKRSCYGEDDLEYPHRAMESKTGFTESNVPFGHDCNELRAAAARTCNDGSWSDWDLMLSEACSVAAAAACTGENDREFTHGSAESKEGYAQDMVAYGGSCSSLLQTQSRMCTNGTWSDWSPELYQTCVAAPPVSCTGEDSSLYLHGAREIKSGFTQRQVRFDQTCESVSAQMSRTCSNGTWDSWSPALYSECSVAAAANCVSSDGAETPHGSEEVRTRYKLLAPDRGVACESEMQRRQCNNGVWSPWSGTYTATACKRWFSCDYGSVCIEYQYNTRFIGCTVTVEEVGYGCPQNWLAGCLLPEVGTTGIRQRNLVYYTDYTEQNCLDRNGEYFLP